jgi:hypothetical protein
MLLYKNARLRSWILVRLVWDTHLTAVGVVLRSLAISGTDGTNEPAAKPVTKSPFHLLPKKKSSDLGSRALIEDHDITATITLFFNGEKRS